MVLLFASTVTAQERTVSGRVTSTEDDLGLPGVTVVVKGTTKGASTDLDGDFIIFGVKSAIICSTLSLLSDLRFKYEICWLILGVIFLQLYCVAY